MRSHTNTLQARCGRCSLVHGWQECISCIGPTGAWQRQGSSDGAAAAHTALLAHTACVCPPPCPCCRGQDVLLFPAVQRHRYFRLKQRLPTAAAHAARLAAAAFAGAAATAVVRARALGSAPPPLTLGGSAAALLAGWLCAFCWLAGTAALEVVFTERLRPDDYSDRWAAAGMAGLQGASAWLRVGGRVVVLQAGPCTSTSLRSLAMPPPCRRPLAQGRAGRDGGVPHGRAGRADAVTGAARCQVGARGAAADGWAYPCCMRLPGLAQHRACRALQRVPPPACPSSGLTLLATMPAPPHALRSHLASDVGKASLRRADLFLDESGDRWRPVAGGAGRLTRNCPGSICAICASTWLHASTARPCPTVGPTPPLQPPALPSSMGCPLLWRRACCSRRRRAAPRPAGQRQPRALTSGMCCHLALPARYGSNMC